MRRMAGPEAAPVVAPVVGPEEILAARALLGDLYVDERVEGYVVDLVLATREPARYGLRALEGLVAYGASPRATIALNVAARAHAFLDGRAYVTRDQAGQTLAEHRRLQ